MKHLTKGRSFGRDKDQKKALMRSLAESFLLHEKITTTEAKAKELRPYVEKLVSRGRNKTLHNQRLFQKSFRVEIQKKLFELGKKYIDRPGGYTRITKLSPRASDSARMAVIEFV
jgi:large subunit ribosomal protein L17